MASIFLRFSSAKLFAPPQETIFRSLQCRSRPSVLSQARCLPWRSFTSTVRQSAVKSSKSAVKQLKQTSQPAARALQASKQNRTGYESFSESLARRPSPTTLYEAPSPRLYITGCWVLATLCFAYAVSNFESLYLHPPENISSWIPTTVGAVCVGMFCFGIWVSTGAYRIVRTITALPRQPNSVQQPLLLRIDNAAVFPGIRPRSVVVPHNDIVLSEYAFIQPVKLSPAEVMAERMEVERKLAYLRARVLTLPFRQANYWTWRGFMAMKSIIWKDDWIYLQVVGRNKSFKLDRNAAWALDNGRALDRVVKHRLSDI